MLSSKSGALRSAWTDIGWGGRAAAALLTAATVVAIVLGIAIPRAAEHHLLHGREAALRTVATVLADDAPGPSATTDDVVAFDELVRALLLGGETVGAKLWSRDGRILYATEPSIVGSHLRLPAEALAAFGGEGSVAVVPGELHPELGTDGRVVEFFFPVVGGDADDPLVFEVEQLATSLENEVSQIATTVWIGIGLGLGLLVLVLGAAAVAFGRTSEQRRRHTERLLRQALLAQESERKRIIAALHSDVGQRLYRVLYGLEGIRARGLDSPSSSEEIGRLEELVRQIDGTLRSELRMLHRDAIHEVGFGPALRELSETTRLESGVAVEVDDRLHPAPAAEVAGLLLWAAEEAVINARKHADASRISIRAWREGDEAMIEVRDDGSGLHGPEGIGLRTLTERLTLAGGGLAVEARKGLGTVVRARVPHEMEPS